MDLPPPSRLGRMDFALDYDNTWTKDPAFWLDFIDLCKTHGHRVQIVTVRDERHDRTPPLVELELVLPVNYTRGVAKGWFMTHFGHGYLPNVWIDDSPSSIYHNSEFSPDQLTEWRSKRIEE